MIILKRPPGDSFTFRLFANLSSKVTRPKNSIYIWSAVLDSTYSLKTDIILPEREQPEEKIDSLGRDVIYYFYESELYYRNLLSEKISADLVILGIKDHLTSGDFNYWRDDLPSIVKYVDSLFDFYKEKKFIFFTSLENLHLYIDRPNVKIVPWGGDIVNHKKEYQTLEPVFDKNLNSDKTFLSLNRNKRSHRAMLVSLLHGLGIHEHGLISCMFKDSIDNLFEYTKWQVKDKNVYQDGFNMLKCIDLELRDDPKIYYRDNNDNVSNFRNKLLNYYRNTFVEIVSETSFTERCYNLTEKTLHSFYGCCFPIILCSKGAVKFLRDMGLDMFDDIIDHSYDNIEDPAMRLESAILSNIELLTNNSRTKKLWIDNQDRFKNNVDFCQKNLYDFYSNRAITLFDEIIDDYKL